MQEVIRFALLGFGVGALYALASQGLIVIYRGSGVLNFALGAIGMAGAYFEWELHHQPRLGRSCLALIAGVARVGAHRRAHPPASSCARCGTASPLVRVIATLGVLITIQSIAVLRYRPTSKLRRRASCRPTSSTSTGRS